MRRAPIKFFKENMKTRQEIGAVFEEAAAQSYKNSGYIIAQRNYRCRYGEIDLIAESKDEVVFAEVKARKQAARFSPSMAVDAKKVRRIKLTALDYLRKSRQLNNTKYRYDIVEVTIIDDNINEISINVIKNAF